MGSRGASANVGQQYTGMGAFSREAAEAGNNSRNTLIQAVNLYNEKEPEERLRIKQVSDDGTKLTLANGDKVPTNNMLTRVGLTNGGKVIQVLDGKKNVVFEGFFDKYQDYIRAGKFKDSYSTRIVRK